MPRVIFRTWRCFLSQHTPPDHLQRNSCTCESIIWGQFGSTPLTWGVGAGCVWWGFQMLTCAHIGEAGTAVVPEDEALSGCQCAVLQTLNIFWQAKIDRKCFENKKSRNINTSCSGTCATQEELSGREKQDGVLNLEDRLDHSKKCIKGPFKEIWQHIKKTFK